MGLLHLNPGLARPLLTLTLLAAATAPAGAQQVGVLPDTGSAALIGNCALTLDGAAYQGCECRMVVSASGGQYTLSGLNVGCQGQAALAGALSGQIGQTGRSLQVLYDQGPTTANGAGTWLSTRSASLDNVIADEDWLLMTLRLAGPTQFENTRGRACVDGATGAPC
jgi:hypothetical protein